MSARMIMKNDYSKRSMPLNWGVSKSLTTSGYCDYNWWHQIDQEGAFFVTRLKRNASIRVLKSRSTEGDILSDEVIEFKNKWPGGGRKNNYVKPLRRIVVHREDHVDPLVLVTNLMGVPVEEVAALYKQRWAIVLWFKWVKQNLKIKKFLGQSENAVKIQILVALITYLIADLYRQLCGSRRGFYLWLAELKSTLFQRPRLEFEVLKRRRKWKSDFQIHQAQLAL